jgi:hypothetical protein
MPEWSVSPHRGCTYRDDQEVSMRALFLYSISALTGCQPDIDFSLDDGEFGFYDGCPTAPFGFGCPVATTPLAVGARARVYARLAPTIGDGDALGRAEIRSTDPTVVTVRWSSGVADDDSRFVEVDAVTPGTVDLEIVDGETVLLSQGVEVAAIAALAPVAESPNVFASQPLGVRVSATDADGRLLYAQGALTAETTGVFHPADLDAGHFVASEQLEFMSSGPGTGTITVTNGTELATTTFNAVTNADVERFEILGPTRTPEPESPLFVLSEIDGQIVRGAPYCEWSLVEGAAILDIRRTTDVEASWLIPVYESVNVRPLGVGTVTVGCSIAGAEVARRTIVFE